MILNSFNENNVNDYLNLENNFNNLSNVINNFNDRLNVINDDLSNIDKEFTNFQNEQLYEINTVNVIANNLFSNVLTSNYLNIGNNAYFNHINANYIEANQILSPQIVGGQITNSNIYYANLFNANIFGDVHVDGTIHASMEIDELNEVNLINCNAYNLRFMDDVGFANIVYLIANKVNGGVFIAGGLQVTNLTVSNGLMVALEDPQEIYINNLTVDNLQVSNWQAGNKIQQDIWNVNELNAEVITASLIQLNDWYNVPYLAVENNRVVKGQYGYFRENDSRLINGATAYDGIRQFYTHNLSDEVSNFAQDYNNSINQLNNDLNNLKNECYNELNYLYNGIANDLEPEWTTVQNTLNNINVILPYLTILQSMNYS